VKLTHVKSLHIEFSTICQARCLQCTRHLDNGVDLNPYATLNKEAPVDLFKKMVTEISSLGDECQLREILICGNSGDPLGSKYIADFCSFVLEKIPSIRMSIHTNGGLGTRETWKRLARVLNGENGGVSFSIDGLEDTNHLYRRNVSWRKIMENAKTFIGEGGAATWKMLRFSHNEHQIEEARKMALEMGFCKFNLKEPYQPLDCINFESSPGYGLPLEEREVSLEYASEYMKEKWSEYEGKSNIECQFMKGEYVFIDNEALVWPCCWISCEPHSENFVRRKWFLEKVVGRYSPNFNSLQFYSLSEILAHEWMGRELPESFGGSETSCFTCRKFCGHST
jgi:MoaA/NifB/PqqE/SkfB family radical SAM enzyme